MIDFAFSWWEKLLMKCGWYKFLNFIDDWVYPAHCLRNLLFYRYDLIKIPQLKPYEYSDMNYRMLCANMQMIVDFIEKEHPEKYVLWYKDENGNDVGHKYGECEKYTVIYPELKDKWIMDIIKEIYHWWKEDYPRLMEEKAYLLDFWSEYVCGTMKSGEPDENGLSPVYWDKTNCIKSLDDLKDKKVRWDIIDKYAAKREDILIENFLHCVIREAEVKIENECQKYLHLCIEVRPYLWT